MMTPYIPLEKLTYTLLLVIVLASGCAQIDSYLPSVKNTFPNIFEQSVDESNLTPAQRTMRDQANAFNKTIIEGVMVGALMGAGTQLIRGRTDMKDLMEGALIGGAAGGLAGAYIAYRQKGYADRENALNSMILSVHGKNQQTEQFIASMQEVVAEDKRKLASLKAKHAQQEITQEEYQRQLNTVRRDREIILTAHQDGKDQLTDFQRAKELYEQDNPRTDTTALDEEIKTFKSHVDTISDIAAELAAVG